VDNDRTLLPERKVGHVGSVVLRPVVERFEMLRADEAFHRRGSAAVVFVLAQSRPTRAEERRLFAKVFIVVLLVGLLQARREKEA
jgi:hypothetical protein